MKAPDVKVQQLENELRAERERRLAAERRAEVLEEAAKRACRFAVWSAIPSRSCGPTECRPRF